MNGNIESKNRKKEKIDYFVLNNQIYTTLRLLFSFSVSLSDVFTQFIHSFTTSFVIIIRTEGNVLRSWNNK